jgi:nitrite reductase/ring-hydroxylating ferredoxin subunit
MGAWLYLVICERVRVDPRVKLGDDGVWLCMSDPPEEYVAVANVADIPPGGMKCVAIDRNRVLLAQVDGRFYAISDICGHRNAPLSRGRLDGHVVECPLHFAQFDVRTGKLVDGPVSADVACYETRVEGGTVFLKR